MNDPAPDWLADGEGPSGDPRVRWAFATDGRLLDLTVARESGDVLAADDTGSLYRLDRAGRIAALSRSLAGLTAVAWSDTGGSGAITLADGRLGWLNERLRIVWELELRDSATALAVDPWGEYAAVSLEGRHTQIISRERRRVGSFVTPRPLAQVAFLFTRAALLGAADSGLLCCHALDGGPLWIDPDWANTGRFSATVDDEKLYVAAYTRGVRVLSLAGEVRESYLLEGTPSQVSATAQGERLAVATVEHHLYWLDADGELLWAALCPEPISRVVADPNGTGLVCGLGGGRIVRLEW